MEYLVILDHCKFYVSGLSKDQVKDALRETFPHAETKILTKKQEKKGEPRLSFVFREEIIELR